MITEYSYAFISVFLVSFISLTGLITLSFHPNTLRRSIHILVGLAAGALLGDSFIHLIPEALAEAGGSALVPLVIILGILFFFILEKTLHWHHHHGDESAEHEEPTAILPVGRLILVSDAIHNLIDGLIIGASYLVSVEVGIATTIAVLLHEIPQEIGDFGILVHAGYTRKKALWFNFLSALFAVAGVIAVFVLGETTESVALWLVPLAAGGFIYIAVADLIPELHKTRGVRQSILQLAAVVFGIIAMLSLTALEREDYAIHTPHEDYLYPYEDRVLFSKTVRQALS